jgi:hypothetical protein
MIFLPRKGFYYLDQRSPTACHEVLIRGTTFFRLHSSLDNAIHHRFITIRGASAIDTMTFTFWGSVTTQPRTQARSIMEETPTVLCLSQVTTPRLDET